MNAPTAITAKIQPVRVTGVVRWEELGASVIAWPFTRAGQAVPAVYESCNWTYSEATLHE